MKTPDAAGFLSEKINNIAEYQPNLEILPIRLDANESPFTLSDALRADFAGYIAGAEFNRYPDPLAGDIIAEYGAAYGVPAENLVCSNGSDEMISIICASFLSKGEKAVFLRPDFSMYEFYSSLAEVDVSVYQKPDGYSICFDSLEAQIKSVGARLVIFSNPCNPTGVMYPREQLLGFVRRVAELGAVCVVDEAYMDFARTDESLMKPELLLSEPNLIVLRTLSKLGLAGLRLGFAAANETLIRGIKKVKSPYNVNSASQAMGALALRRFDEFRKNAAKIREGTAALYSALLPFSDSLGFKVSESDANFVFLRFNNPAAPRKIHGELLKRGISVRLFAGLSALRITCGAEEENAALITAIKQISADMR
ncbi:MAG: aminotransferase class I/II-fold pyridoxal phosphate-dependent enzyme [Clostridiales bacterium]|nr:aminotransferase class I/II-fold pyridoxal phosphate-dependent enzyme [Clostridiales bacterium]